NTPMANPRCPSALDKQSSRCLRRARSRAESTWPQTSHPCRRDRRTQNCLSVVPTAANGERSSRGGFLLDRFQIPGANRLWPVETIIQRQQPMHETHHESTKSHNPNQARALDKIGYHQTADEIVHL